MGTHTRYRRLIRRLHQRLFLLGAFALTGGPSHGQRLGWSLQHFDVTNGLPQSSVLDMAVDSLQFLWLTTENGLVRFDGSRFKVIRPRSAENSTQRMREIIRSRQGELLVVDGLGNLLMEHGHSAVFRIQEGPRFMLNGTVQDLSQAMLHCSRSGPIFRVLGKRSRLLFDLGGGSWTAICEQAGYHFKDTVLVASWPMDLPLRKMWLYGSRIVGIDKDGAWQSYDPRNGDIRALARSGAWPVQDLRSWQVVTHVEDDLGYLCTEQRLYELVVDSVHHRIEAEDLGIELPADAQLSKVAWLNGGQALAVGTTNMGLLLYRRHQVQVMDARSSGERFSTYYAQAELPNGDHLVLGSEGLVKFTAAGEHQLYRDMPVPDWASMGLAMDGHVILLMGSHLVRMDPRTGDTSLVDSEVNTSSAMLVEEDRIWVGDRDRLAYLDGDLKRTTVLDIGSKRGRDRPLALARDGSGRMIMATCEAVLRSRDPACTVFDTIPGSHGLCARTLHPTSAGVLIGTYGSGLYLLDSTDALIAMPLDPIGALRCTHAIIRDHKDRLWMSTNQGIVTCLATELEDPNARARHSTFFGYVRTLHGMRSAEFNGGCTPSGLLLRDGSIAFSSMSGLVRFHPDSITDPYSPAGHLLHNVRIDGVPHPVDERIEMDQDDQTISFEVTVAYWGDPVNAQLEYTIPDLMDEWAPIDLTEGDLAVIRPPAGRYELYIREVGTEIPMDLDHAAIQFVVLPPFWRTMLGQVLLLTASGILIWLIIRIQSFRSLRRERELKRLVNERTSELAARNMDLVRSMRARESLMAVISHDIVTPLRFIASAARSALPMVGGGKDRDLRETLDDLSLSAEKLRGNASAILAWIKHDPESLKPDLRPLDLYRQVEDSIAIWQVAAGERSLELENLVPKEAAIVADAVILQVVLTNLIGNAVNHGLESTRITMSATRTDDGWHIHVQDDGRGLSKDMLERVRMVMDEGWGGVTRSHAGTDGQGIGLAVAAGLVALLGGCISVESDQGRTVFSVGLPMA
ncbi:MAG: HAMP domain-containing sensor histidine kinase [Flavobacteriales bacterium]